MGGPSWVAVGLAAIMIITALYCAGRLAASGRWRRATELDADAAHVVMGTAMAGMLLPSLSPFPGTWWAAVFAAGAAWFSFRAIRGNRGRSGGWLCSHPLPHLVESAAMIYMLIAVPAAPGQQMQMPMPGVGGADAADTSFRALAVALAFFMIGYVLWTADQLASLARTTAAPARAAASQPAGLLFACRPTLAPRLAACYKIAMGLTMGYMLVMAL